MTLAKTALWIALFLTPSVAYAQYPPPQSAQDAACRKVAERRVFSEQGRPGESMVDRGRAYWQQCMGTSARAKASKAAKPTKRKSTRTKKSRRRS